MVEPGFTLGSGCPQSQVSQSSKEQGCSFPCLIEETDVGGGALPEAALSVTGSARSGPPEFQT